MSWALMSSIASPKRFLHPAPFKLLVLFLICGLEASASGVLVPLFGQLFDTGDFPERWFCGNWSSFHGWTHIISDFLIWVAYTSIPIALLVIVRKKRSILPYPYLWVMFSLFIISCGLTHLMESVIFWWPAYRLLGLLKAATAVISVSTALLLLPRLGTILSLKTPEETQRALDELKNRAEHEKKTELAKQLRTLESILEDSFAGYWDWDLSQGTMYYSDKFLEMFGYTRGEFGEDPDAWLKLLDAETLQRVQRVTEQHIQSRGKVPFDVTLDVPHRDGHMVHIIRRGHVSEWSADGQPMRMVGCHVDVTPLVEVELALSARNEQLEMVASGINAGIWDWSIPGNDVWWSARFYELLGYENAEISSGFDSFLENILHPDFHEALDRKIKAHLEEGEPFRIELKLRCKSGEYRWFDSVGQASFDNAGQPVRMVGSIIDIDLRRQFESKDKKTIAVLSDQNERLVNFAHIISHNLRSSSGNLVALLPLLAEEQDAEGQVEILKHIESCANQMHETVEYLTDVVRIQTQTDQKIERLSFEEIFQKAKQNFVDELQAIGAEVETDFSELPEIEYVRSYLMSIFTNFLSNSIRYRRENTPLSIRIQTTISNGQKSMIFSDNGTGIDLEKNRNKLFGLYKTFHTNPEAKGVGLFLLKNQVEALGGKIEAESQVDQGITFTIKFN